MAPSLPVDDRWRGRAAIAAATIARFGVGSLMGTVLAVYVGRQGSAFAVSMVFAVFSLGTLLFAPVWGALGDITGRRRALLIVTGALASVALVPLLFVDHIPTLIGVRGVYAVFAAGFLPLLLTIASEAGEVEERGRSIGLVTSSRSVGWTTAQLTAGALLGLLAPRWVFATIVGISAVATLATVFIADPTPATDAELTLGTLSAEVKDRLVPSVGNREHLTANGLHWLYLALFLRHVPVLGIFSLLPVFLTEQVGTSEFVMGALLSLNPSLQVLFMYLLGRTADLVGRKPLVAVGALGSGVFGFLVAAATIPGVLELRIGLVAVGSVVMAVSFSALDTGTYAFIGDVAALERESELMGLSSLVRGLGGVAGPVIVGAAATVLSYELTFAAMSLLPFLAAVLVARYVAESHATERGLREAVADWR